MAKLSTKGSKSKVAENIGKGKVTPVQVAFIVDRYLLDNDFTKTRSAFRSEASNLISKSPVQEAPKSLLSLAAILDEYIHLKELKVTLDQERCRMEQDKFRIDNLLNGLQDAMNTFNATAHLVTPPHPHPHPLPPQQSHPINSGITSPNINNEPSIGSPPGYYSAYRSPAVIPSFNHSNSRGDTMGVSSQTTNRMVFKRKASKDVFDASLTAKKSRRSLTTTNQLLSTDPMAHSQPCTSDNQVPSQEDHADQSLVHTKVSGGSIVNGSDSVQSSHVVKRLFSRPVQSPPTTSSDPTTPPLPLPSQAEKTASPVAMRSTVASSEDITPQQITSTNCTIISTETIRVSPVKQISYYSIARNQHISTRSPVKASFKKANKRDHVKGRLDFDVSDVHTTSSEKPALNEISTSECVKEVDFLDLDLTSLEALGNLNLSQLLVDIDLADEGTSYSSQPAVDSSPDSITWSPQKSVEVNIGANQVFSQLSSTVTEIVSEKDTTSYGPDPFTTVKSVTKTIKILSPAKRQRSGLDHEELPVQDKLD